MDKISGITLTDVGDVSSSSFSVSCSELLEHKHYTNWISVYVRQIRSTLPVISPCYDIRMVEYNIKKYDLSLLLPVSHCLAACVPDQQRTQVQQVHQRRARHTLLMYTANMM